MQSTQESNVADIGTLFIRSKLSALRSYLNFVRMLSIMVKRLLNKSLAFTGSQSIHFLDICARSFRTSYNFVALKTRHFLL